METGLDKAKLLQYKARALKMFGDPVRLRLTIVFGLVALGLGAVYMPLSDRIDLAQRQLAQEKKRFGTISEVDGLRQQVQMFRPHIAEKSDTNEWVQYLLSGSRQAKVRLKDMESREPQKIGPYRAVTLAVEVEGTFPQLQSFVEWIERSDRLLRIDDIRMEKMPNVLTMKIRVLGLVRKNA